MSTTTNKNNDTMVEEYVMPEHIKALITDDFLKEFRNQLFRIHEYYSLDTVAEEGPAMNTSTAGWYAAFGKACLLTNKAVLLDYRSSLPWYDSDVFDGEITDLLVERGFMFGDLSALIEEKLGIKAEDLRTCNDCGRYYTKDMVVEISDPEEIWISEYRCLHCQDLKDTKDEEMHTTDYYRNVLNELSEYCAAHPIDTSNQKTKD